MCNLENIQIFDLIEINAGNPEYLDEIEFLYHSGQFLRGAFRTRNKNIYSKYRYGLFERL